jgi:tripartite-type tricarboxylate transporter receptor subunit TctC
MKGIVFVAAVVVVTFSSASTHAQSDAAFPERPIRYIVPFPPGGSTDIVARVVANALTEQLGQQVVIDNRGGAGGTVGAAIAARATADGYHIFACNIASLAVSPALYRDPGYDASRDFAPIGLIGSNPNALAVHPTVPAQSVAEFIALAKSRPGKMNYASAGVGTSPQLSMELFKMNAGLDIVHIAYKGAGPAVADLVGGHVHAMFSTVPSLLGAVKGGKVRMLAVTSSKRFPDLPDVPTIAESGMPDFEVISWQGLCTPSGAPSQALERLRSALSTSLERAGVRKQLSDQGIVPTPLFGDAYNKFIKAEQAKWTKVVSDLRIEKK